MLPATALAPFACRCVTQTFTVQNKPAAVAPKETITHHFFVSNWAEENCRCSQIYGAENVVKTETQQTFVNGLLGFITLGIYTPLKCVLLTHQDELPIDMGNSHSHYSLIYFWVPSKSFA